MMDESFQSGYQVAQWLRDRQRSKADLTPFGIEINLPRYDPKRVERFRTEVQAALSSNEST
jgi:hypothetical protein